jgi:DNA topoisomerase IA
MSILIYNDIITKYQTNERFERSFSHSSSLSDESYYDVYKRSRYISISQMLESLYEDNLISYAHTNSSVLSINQFDERFAIFNAIAESCYDEPSVRFLLTKMDMNLMKAGCWVSEFNHNHYGLAPTIKPVEMHTYFNTLRRPYEEIRKKMYLDICKGYVKLFIPD